MSTTALDPDTARALRMRALLLAPGVLPRPESVAEVVTWFGAMQAQDLGSGLLSFGVRLPHLTMADVQAATEAKEAVRTWPMRGTVHFVPPRDARWMLGTTGVKALAGAAKRREFLGLSAADADRAVEVLRAGLTVGGRLTRAECVALLADAGLVAEGNFAYHLLWYASQHGVTCIGPNVGSEQTFVLLDEWVPDRVTLTNDEALRTLAVRYCRSHGPATRKDFAGWTGLSMSDVRRGIELAGDELAPVEVDGSAMYLAAAALESPAEPLSDELVALPGFDEYLLGYKDRSLFIGPDDLQVIVPGGNGVFRPTLVRAGRVVGTWKRGGTPRSPKVDVTALPGHRTPGIRALKTAFEGYSRYLGTDVMITRGA